MEPRSDMMLGAMRYLPEFRGATEEQLRPYLYGLFNEPTFGPDPETRKQWQQNLLTDAWSVIQKARTIRPGVFQGFPEKAEDFYSKAVGQTRAYKPIPEWEQYGTLEVPRPDTPLEKMTVPERRYLRVIDEFNQRYPGMGKELFYAGMTLKNLFIKPFGTLTAAIAAPWIVPKPIRKVAMKLAERWTPELDFAAQISRDYGPVAGFFYSFAEAVPTIMAGVGATKAALGVIGASRIPVASAIAGNVAARPALFNTAFWGAYSSGAYNQMMAQMKKEPTFGGYALNLAIGGAVGKMFPGGQKLLNWKKNAPRYVNEVLTPLLETEVNNLRKMSTGQLVDALRAKGFTGRKMQEAVTLMRYFKQPTKALVQDYLKQSTKAGALGLVSGAVSARTAGLPIDLPSLAQNATFMMMFHAWGALEPKFGLRVRPTVAKVADGLLKVGEEPHKRLLANAFGQMRSADEPMERWLPRFINYLKSAGVNRVEVAKDNVVSLDDFVRNFVASTGKNGYRDALKSYADAVLLGKSDIASEEALWAEGRARARLDGIIAQMSRKQGTVAEVPHERVATQPDVPETPQMGIDFKRVEEQDALAVMQMAAAGMGKKEIHAAIDAKPSIEVPLESPRAKAVAPKKPRGEPRVKAVAEEKTAAQIAEEATQQLTQAFAAGVEAAKVRREKIAGKIEARPAAPEVPPAKAVPIEKRKAEEKPVVPSKELAPKRSVVPVKAPWTFTKSEFEKRDRLTYDRLKVGDVVGKYEITDIYQKGLGNAYDVRNLRTGETKTFANIGALRTEFYGSPIHKGIVEKALSEGKVVPPDVLKEYESFQKPSTRVAPKAEKPTVEAPKAAPKEEKPKRGKREILSILSSMKENYNRLVRNRQGKIIPSPDNTDIVFRLVKQFDAISPEEFVSPAAKRSAANVRSKVSRVRDYYNRMRSIDWEKREKLYASKRVQDQLELAESLARAPSAKVQAWVARRAVERRAKEGVMPEETEVEWRAARTQQIRDLKKAIQEKDYEKIEKLPVLLASKRGTVAERELIAKRQELIKEGYNVKVNAVLDRIYGDLDAGKIDVAKRKFDALDDAMFGFPGSSKWVDVGRSLTEKTRGRCDKLRQDIGEKINTPTFIKKIEESPLKSLIERVSKSNKIYSSTGVPDYESAKEFILAGVAVVKEKARRKALMGDSLVDKIFGLARALRTHRDTKDSLLSHLGHLLIYGPPESVATPQQWKWIQAAIRYNQTNPHMADGKGGSISALDFIRVSVNRLNFEPGSPNYKPLTRQEARTVLQSYARISETIQNRNWPIAMTMFLPSAMKRWNPWVNRYWDILLRWEHKLNALSVDFSKAAEEYTAKWGNLNAVNEKTLTPEAQVYFRKQYGPIWEKWHVPDPFANGRTKSQEIQGLISEVISSNDPFLHPASKEIAAWWKEPIQGPWGRLARVEYMWRLLNRAVTRNAYMLGGAMRVNRDTFRNVYVQWKMGDRRTTPENAEAMRIQFGMEAEKILTDPKQMEKTIDTIVKSRMLGKILNARERNIYYPGREEGLSERMLEEAENLEAGILPQGRIGEIRYAKHRTLSVEQHMALDKPDFIKDIGTYVRDVSSYIWRSEVRYQHWQAKKRIMGDIAKSPEHAKVFQHHLEIMEKIQGDITGVSEKFLDNVSAGFGNLASAVFLAHPGTVTRNFIGGNALTVIYNGLGWFTKAVNERIRPSEETRRELGQLGVELTSTWGTDIYPTPWQLARKKAIAGKPELSALDAARLVTRHAANYALSHPIPFVLDFIPGANKLFKRFSFTGSEVFLREVAYLAGYMKMKQRLEKGGRLMNAKIRMTADSPAALREKVWDKHGVDLAEEQIQVTTTKAGEKRFSSEFVGLESEKDFRARIQREARQAGLNSIVMTQFVYSRLNMPAVMKHPLGRIILMFKRYTWNRFDFATQMIKRSMPEAGGGPEELARFLRFSIALSGALALSSLININLYRFVEDDVIAMWSQVMDAVKTGEFKPYGRPWERYVSGPLIGRTFDFIDTLQNDDIDWSRKFTMVPVVPYGRMINDFLVEQQKVSEGRKSIFDSMANKIIGLQYYTYGGEGRRRRRTRRGRR